MVSLNWCRLGFRSARLVVPLAWLVAFFPPRLLLQVFGLAVYIAVVGVGAGRLKAKEVYVAAT